MKNIKITVIDAITGHSRERNFAGVNELVNWAEEQTSGIDLPDTDTAARVDAAFESFRTVEIVCDGVRIATRDLFVAVAEAAQ